MQYHFFDRFFRRFIDLLADFMSPKSGSQKKMFNCEQQTNNNKQTTTDRFWVDLEVARTLSKHLKMLPQLAKR